ncbi:pectinesterase inhibitor 10-like [Nicotiana tomentosiformis]|uniref:pectinesterase inhibitor 10-like n=1 Tax=Nicotiana tomentosiformis TaxID=4098 RepID=UPI00388C5080
MAPGKKKKTRHDFQHPQHTSGPTTSSVPFMSPPPDHHHQTSGPTTSSVPFMRHHPPPPQQTSLPPGFFTLPPCDPVKYKPISNSHSMHTIPSYSPAYRTSQHGDSLFMPPSSVTPTPSYHVSQNDMAPSSSPSSSTPSVSRPHLGGSTN